MCFAQCTCQMCFAVCTYQLYANQFKAFKKAFLTVSPHILRARISIKVIPRLAKDKPLKRWPCAANCHVAALPIHGLRNLNKRIDIWCKTQIWTCAEYVAEVNACCSHRGHVSWKAKRWQDHSTMSDSLQREEERRGEERREEKRREEKRREEKRREEKRRAGAIFSLVSQRLRQVKIAKKKAKKIEEEKEGDEQ